MLVEIFAFAGCFVRLMVLIVFWPDMMPETSSWVTKSIREWATQAVFLEHRTSAHHE